MNNPIVGKLAKLTKESDKELLSLFVDLAKGDILEHTNRTEMLPVFETVWLDLAIARYRAKGIEGTASYSEGGVSSSIIKKEEILAPLNKYRLPKVGGVVFERRKSEEVPSTEVPTN